MEAKPELFSQPQSSRGLTEDDQVFSSHAKPVKNNIKKSFDTDKTQPDKTDQRSSITKDSTLQKPPKNTDDWIDSKIQFKYAMLSKAPLQPQERKTLLNNQYLKNVEYIDEISKDEYNVFYDNERERPIISYRGTKVYKGKDLKSDSNIFTDNEKFDKRFQQSLKAFDKVKKYFEVDNNEIDITGTSLGGSLGLFVSERKDTDSYVFNPGITPWERKKHSFGPKNREGNAFIWRTINDPISIGALTNKQNKNRHVIELGPLQNDSNPLQSHFVHQFFPNEDGEAPERVSKKEAMGQFNDDVSSMVERAGEFFNAPDDVITQALIDALEEEGNKGDTTRADKVIERAVASAIKNIAYIASTIPIDELESTKEIYQNIENGKYTDALKNSAKLGIDIAVDYATRALGATALEAGMIASPLVFISVGLAVAGPQLEEALPKAKENIKDTLNVLYYKSPKHVKKSFRKAGEALQEAVDEDIPDSFSKAGESLQKAVHEDIPSAFRKGGNSLKEGPKEFFEGLKKAGKSVSNEELHLPSGSEIWSTIVDAFGSG